MIHICTAGVLVVGSSNKKCASDENKLAHNLKVWDEIGGIVCVTYMSEELILCLREVQGLHRKACCLHWLFNNTTVLFLDLQRAT